MALSLNEFLNELFHNPIILVITLLTLGVILVNGWTDAPNAIATSISTRSISPRNAIILATIFNFLGVLVMTLINATVAQTIYNMVDFRGDTHDSLIALCAAMVAIVLWATFAWYFGIPTSESHALIAGISGAAIALQKGFSGINGSEWIKVIYGLFVSTFFGFGLGYLTAKIIGCLFKDADKRKVNKLFTKAQVLGSCGMAFMHGAQDGQKFMGVFMLGIFLLKGYGNVNEFTIPVWLMLTCSGVMALGTSLGGLRIIKKIGIEMVKLETYQGFASDLAGSLSLLTASVFGLPVSTTHTKTTAIMGVGCAKRLSAVNWAIVKDMVYTWILTFPGCGLIGYLMALVFMKMF